MALYCFSTTFRSILLPLRAVFHTYFGICWNFTAFSQIVQQIHVKITLFLGLFQAYRQKSNFSFLRCAKSKTFDMIRHASSLTGWTFPENPQKVQIFLHVLALKKTMIVITIAFVSCVVWVYLRLPDANSPLLWLRSGIERSADRKTPLPLSVLRFGVCRSSDLSIHAQRIFLAQTHCFSLLSGLLQSLQ